MDTYPVTKEIPITHLGFRLWSQQFKETYCQLFGGMNFIQAIHFVRLINTPNIRLEIPRIEMIRYHIHTDNRIYKLGVIAPLTQPLIEDLLPLNSRFDLHHIVPRSMGGYRQRGNCTKWPHLFHGKYHRLFQNMTLQQIYDFLNHIHKPQYLDLMAHKNPFELPRVNTLHEQVKMKFALKQNIRKAA